MDRCSWPPRRTKEEGMECFAGQFKRLSWESAVEESYFCAPEPGIGAEYWDFSDGIPHESCV